MELLKNYHFTSWEGKCGLLCSLLHLQKGKKIIDLWCFENSTSLPSMTCMVLLGSTLAQKVPPQITVQVARPLQHNWIELSYFPRMLSSILLLLSPSSFLSFSWSISLISLLSFCSYFPVHLLCNRAPIRNFTLWVLAITFCQEITGVLTFSVSFLSKLMELW